MITLVNWKGQSFIVDAKIGQSDNKFMQIIYPDGHIDLYDKKLWLAVEGEGTYRVDIEYEDGMNETHTELGYDFAISIITGILGGKDRVKSCTLKRE